MAAVLTLAAPAFAADSIHDMLVDVKRGKWTAAEKELAGIHDPLGIKLYYWLYYTKGRGPVQFNRAAAFVRANPDWPRQGKLRLAVETAMTDDLPDAQVVYWFADHPPQTALGMDRYLVSLIKLGKHDEAGKILREEWKDANLDLPQQAYFMRKFPRLLDKDAHLLRMDYLLSTGQDRAARAVAQALGGYYPAVCEARIALAAGRADAYAFVAAVPATLQHEPALLLEELRWQRRRGNDYAAINILHSMPPPESIANPGDWWQERNIMVRRLMDNHQYESAYLLARDHGLTRGESYADAEFLSGWLALRFVNRPWDAFEHFERLYKNSTSPITRARGAYWAGQASTVLGYGDIARQWYQAAAKHQTTFYGQLAIGELKEEFRPMQQLPPQKTLDGQLMFDKKDMVRAARALSLAGMTAETTDFLEALSAGSKTPEEYRMTAELAENLGHPQNAVRIAKKALAKSVLLMDQLFPTILSHMRHVAIEWALTHALIRQESAFDPQAVSSAGAQGIMQVMPSTAKHVARVNHIPWHPDALSDDEDYNIQIGSLYFKEVLDKYNGYYPLALAAYNAGPARVDSWIAAFGDPRRSKLGVADWVEQIPISETRNYVQRVLEAVYIYRLKLKGVQKSYNSPIHVALGMKD
ncbi:MAG TPA: lytic transglycosylase domain-containing protein [Patescibacteria group bacterium]|nr:lytic transglycosylase domain-containing protein [Patescibacteria group bacterium]